MKKLYKSTTNKKIGGVAAGIAEYLNIDPTVIRVLFAIGIIIAGSTGIAYLLLMFILPKDYEVDQSYTKNEQSYMKYNR